MAFVDNLIDDSVILGQAKGGKGTQSKKRQVSCPSRQVDDKCKQVHKFEDLLGKSKFPVNKGAKAIKHSPSNTHGTNEESKRLSVDGLTEDAITKMVPGHLKVGKSHSTSARHTKQQTGASTSRSNLNYVERDSSAEIQQKGNLATGEIEALVTGSGDRFKRIVIAASDTSESSDDDPSNDDINFYKTKFIRDEKLEEKKRRIRLMKNRKETDVVKTTKKKLTLNGKGKTPGSKENLSYERPFSEKYQLCKTKLSNLTTETNEKKSKGWKLKQPIRTDNKKDDYLKSKSSTKSLYEENHAVHRQRILEKFGNIFGYDTDSEDLTLSPESYCSSVERCSRLNTSGIRRLSLSGHCSPSSSVSSQSHVHGDDEYSKGISTATNAKEQSIDTSFNDICSDDDNNNNSNTSSNSSNYNIRRRRSFDGYKNSFHSEQESSGTSPSGDRISGGKSLSNINSGSGLTSKKDSVSQLDVKRDVSFQSPSLLAGLKEYIPRSSTEISVQPEIVPQFYEDNLLAAVNQGDCDALLQLLSLSDISLPSLPFLSLLAGAIQAGRSGVAQVLAALSWGVDPPASHNQDQWGRVVEAAAVKGDLSLLLVLSTMSRDSTTRAPSTLSRGLQLCAHEGAQRCAQQHVLAALNTSRLSF